MLLTISAFFLIVYALGLFLATRYEPQTVNKDRKSPGTEQPPSVSVLVPFRNERQRLPELLANLSRISYAGSHEFLLIDDHSEDSPLEIVHQHGFSQLRYLPPLKGVEGKKQNLQRAVSEAKGDIILTTDADCRHDPHWIESVVKNFDSDQVKMVLGPVRIEASNYFGRLQAMEFFSVMGVTRLSAKLGYPFMANGANLAYLKKTFFEVQGYSGNEHFSSGDDEFLLRKFSRNHPLCVRFADEVGAVVETSSAQSLREFLHQRIRWAGKWRHNTDPVAFFAAVWIFSIQIITLGLVLTGLVSLEVVHVSLLIKFFAEGYFLKKEAGRQHASFRLGDFLVVGLLYPVYVIVVALFSFWAKPKWKGRKVNI
ncbi:MAG: glycosyltransferase [Cyclobacteriaceae bacterium]